MTALRLLRVLDVPEGTPPRSQAARALSSRALAPALFATLSSRALAPALFATLSSYAGAFVLAVPLAAGTVPALAAGGEPVLFAPQEGFACTLVIGYSQTAQWYEAGGVFESMVGDDRWQLKWAGGAGVDRWSDPDDRAWSADVLSPCATKMDAPDRIVFSISGPFGEDEDAWVAGIKGSLDLIRERYPSARRIVLVPVVGGPSHRDCTLDGRRVRASWQHAHIDNAIEKVVGDDGSRLLVAGPSPEVRTCDDYRDALGHLTEEGAAAMGRMLASIMRGREGAR